jgi:signal transduction histidine kinase
VSRFVPRSLIAQVALLIGAALLVAQLVNFALILNEREKLSLAQNQGPAITRFASIASDFVETPAELRSAVLADNSRRGALFRLERTAGLAPADGRDPKLEERLRQALKDADVDVANVRAALHKGPLPGLRVRAGQRPQDVSVLLLSAQLEKDAWFSGAITTTPRDPWLTTRLAAATILLYVIVLGATLLIALRLTRPLRDLTSAAKAFGGRGLPTRVKPSGPADLRRAIEAFNEMNERVSALLDEKDRMLGGIGHDLRTPLASLRISLESADSEEERKRMIGKVAEMATMLEDILVLARSGRVREEERPMDVAALVDSVAEEFHALGGDVRMEPTKRVVAKVQPVLLRRAIRNLIDNALKYGGVARLAVRQEGSEVAIEVSDEGPGIPPDQLDRVVEAFHRVEGSRNRETGGTGLGLAIARTVAESHGGSLRLANGERGLIATLVIPATPGS